MCHSCGRPFWYALRSLRSLEVVISKLPEEEVFVELKTYFQERNLLIFIPVNRREMQSKNELKQQSVILNDMTKISISVC